MSSSCLYDKNVVETPTFVCENTGNQRIFCSCYECIRHFYNEVLKMPIPEKILKILRGHDGYYFYSTTFKREDGTNDEIILRCDKIVQTISHQSDVLFYEGCVELNNQGIPHLLLLIKKDLRYGRYWSNSTKLIKGINPDRVYNVIRIKDDVECGISKVRNFICKNPIKTYNSGSQTDKPN